jgi:3-dehydroquinate dehydratase I
MTEPRIAATLVERNPDLIARWEAAVDFWELRLDLIGTAWPLLAAVLHKPWIACNRRPQEGGQGQLDESARFAELQNSLQAGAGIVDIELSSPGLSEMVNQVKIRASCLISYHNFENTPSFEVLNEIVCRQKEAGADICKIVTTARSMEDNLSILKLVRLNADCRIVAFAMGPEGRISRILSPLAGAYFTFASLAPGRASAPGQMTVAEMREIYARIVS